MTYPPRPSDDEPHSQPFQPQSYDLAPEFGTQQAPSGGSYPQQPGPYDPPQSYAQPQQPYQQPAYQDPYQASAPPFQPSAPPFQPAAAPFPGQGPAFPPPPPPRRGKGLKITLGILGALFLICAVGCGVFLYPIIDASGTTVTAPETLPGGLKKETSDEMQTIVDQMERDLRNDVGDVDQVAAGIYSTGDPQKLVVIVAATSTVVFPDDEIEDAFKGFNSTGGSVGGQTSYPAGDLGGTVKCASGTEDELPMTLCAWADHGSVGIGVFIGRDLEDASSLFLQIRPAVESR
ncbi:hypothetical protein AB0J72_37350 [Dactylosporangium sp. NPDC049742]|uniref:hypothetical protein n=1 Tax=Dactylosporangium sp. NPDC049742 TaxID=3154737 RepID=UPI00343A03C1